MLGWFKARRQTRASALQLYRSIVAQSRREGFYAHWGVPDTVEGRYEMITIHLFLLHNRLQREDGAGHDLSRKVLEAFMTDMDDNMREEGVSDIKVPRRIKKAAAGIYDRFQAYGAAMGTHDGGADTTLAQVLGESFAAYQDQPAAPPSDGADMAPASSSDVPNVPAISGYMIHATKQLHAQDSKKIVAGTVVFPDVNGADEEGSGDAQQ